MLNIKPLSRKKTRAGRLRTILSGVELAITFIVITGIRIHQPFLRVFFLILVIQIILYFEAFESNTSSDWLNNAV